jgi:hypothetical protein
MNENGSNHDTPDDVGVVLSVLTSEHYNLQTMRAGTIAETNGRAGIFLSAVSAGLVAIGFTAANGVHQPSFLLFALLILAGLVFLGLTTFTRTVQSSIDDALYSTRIDTIRDAYTELAPSIAPTLSKIAGRDIYLMAAERSRWQRFVSVSGTIAAITSILIGAGIGLLGFVISGTTLIAIIAGVVSAVLVDALLMRSQSRKWRRSGAITFLGKAEPPEGQTGN